MSTGQVRLSANINPPGGSALWSVPPLHGHSVQFYEELVDFIGSALATGDSDLVIQANPIARDCPQFFANVASR